MAEEEGGGGGEGVKMPILGSHEPKPQIILFINNYVRTMYRIGGNLPSSWGWILVVNMT